MKFDWDEKARIVRGFEKCETKADVDGLMKFLTRRISEYDADERTKARALKFANWQARRAYWGDNARFYNL